MLENPAWLSATLDHYDIQYNSGRGWDQRVRCPLDLHPDKHPSAGVNLDKGVWKCFTCDRGGDALTIIMEREHATLVEAVEFADSLVGESTDPVSVGYDSGSGELFTRKRNQQRGSAKRWTWGSQ